MPRKLVTPDVLRQLFIYDPETGALTRRSTMKPVYLEWKKRNCVLLELHGAKYNARRVVIAIHTGRWPDAHEYRCINDNPRDLRWSNIIRIKDGDNRRCSTCGEMKHQSEFHSAGKKCFKSSCKVCAKLVNTKHSRRNMLKAKYGITEAEYEAQLDAQGGGCAICGATSSEGGKRLSVDHCHASGNLREILCNTCNTGLGAFRDSPKLLVNAAKYLLKHKQE